MLEARREDESFSGSVEEGAMGAEVDLEEDEGGVEDATDDVGWPMDSNAAEEEEDDEVCSCSVGDEEGCFCCCCCGCVRGEQKSRSGFVSSESSPRSMGTCSEAWRMEAILGEVWRVTIGSELAGDSMSIAGPTL